ncbi:hypothetical protein HQ305_16770 [Rhodococcus sp. BP-149]|uniref:hypothetical protein n=1 Tax=unclassified Rhodococcus (in: high G+C Gram-positive bacteria) TaxID=192944 RepID=UPI001C9A3E46|nr:MULTISPECIES: hypothetical protein [unclassified Rhodococcus (in: high G+C Gram-positive bacteria)]MBY6687214.1 hypothetical protein [Rhodococcus sp. BP-288]MBY6694363.1 hypothetical protein [Rhodococcus sp. BP-188]MBY6698072.1 hypothetical protein [Rhodococcus sp. BP-285]MBY6704292.1 hypothetical protein [Rhodococcus sp. BP-283]MBY6712941.1 hypothetical protein [Rhodococcus sp. BP-160]
MNAYDGNLIIGRLSVKNRLNKRLEPLFVLNEDTWETANLDDFKSSAPLKVSSELSIENNALVASELLKQPKLPGKPEIVYKLGSVRPADIVLTPKIPSSAVNAIESIGDIALPRWISESSDVYVKLEDDRLIGPFRLYRKRLHAQAPERLELRRMADINATEFDGHLVASRISRVSPIGQFDGRSDEKIVDLVADFAVSTLSNLEVNDTQIETTKESLRQISDWLADQHGVHQNFGQEQIDRAMKACGNAAIARRIAQDVARKLGGLPDVVQLLDQAIEEGRANAERGEQVRIAAHVAQERQQLDNLIEEKMTVQNELTKLQAQTKKARIAFDTAQQSATLRSQEVRADVAKAIEEIIEGSRARLTSSIIGRALTSNSPLHSPSPEPAHAHDVVIPEVSSIRLTSPGMINTKIRDSATKQGLQLVAVQRMVGAFHAGLMPVALGNGGPMTITAAADVAYSGRLVRMSIAHDFLHPNDLVGLHSGKTGTLRGNHKVLSTASTAADSGEVVVMFEAINNAPTESYLVPWLQSGQAGYPLQGIDGGKNLKIAGTIATGVTSARISPDLWGHAIVLDTAAFPVHNPDRDYSHIDLPMPEQETSEVTRDLLQDVDSYWPISDDIIQAGDRFASALSGLQSEAQIRRSVAECLLLPAAATSLPDSEYANFADSIARNLSMNEDQSMHYSGLVRRLRMRLG